LVAELPNKELLLSRKRRRVEREARPTEP